MAQAWVVFVIVSAVILTAWFLISDPARGAHLYLLGILAALTAGYLEFTSQVEKRRRLLSAKSSTMNMNSVDASSGHNASARHGRLFHRVGVRAYLDPGGPSVRSADVPRGV